MHSDDVSPVSPVPAESDVLDSVYRDRMRGALAAKEEGNAALQRGDIRRASFCYKKVYLFLADYVQRGEADQDALMGALCARRRASALPESAQRDAENLFAAAQCNLSLAHLKLGRYADGARCATAVLALTGHSANVKALLRRAACRVRLGLIDEAERDVAAAESVTRDPAVETLRAEIAQARRDEENKQREMCRKMFAS